MNTLTHLLISQVIQKTIEDEMSVKLNRIGFMYGNIKPDISTSYAKIPHYKDESFGFIKQEILSLMGTRIQRSFKCTEKFSEKLGVITHYLSDYFCFAHSRHFNGSMIDHYLYEMKLSQYCKSSFQITSAHEFIDVEKTMSDGSNIFRYIDELHDVYMSSTFSFETDMVHALKICSQVCLSILSVCISQQAETAA